MNAFPDFLRRSPAFFARHRLALLFAAAAGFGVLAVFGVRGYLAERLAIEKARLAPAQATVDVVVARHDLEAGSLVDATNMAIRAVPVDFVPGSVVLPDGFDRHAGARLAEPMRSGEPLLATALLNVDRTTFSSRVRPGIRAMSVLVDEVNSVSGMLQPGDRIDLLFTVRPPDAPGAARAQEVTSTLMQNVEVLATGRQVRADAASAGAAPMADARRHFTAITVEVTPVQAQQLIVAQRSGKLTAMLRNPEDRQPLPARAMDLNALLGIEPAAPVAAITLPRGPEIIVGGRGSWTGSRTVVPGQIIVAHPEAPAGLALAGPAEDARFAANAGRGAPVPSGGRPVIEEDALSLPAHESETWRLRGFAQGPTVAPDRLFADKRTRAVQRMSGSDEERP